MAVSSVIPPSTSNVTATTTTGSASSTTGVDTTTLASNFTQFLQLLTTQLKNQNPLDPLDTNQFTQQLVQFAQVEQQLKSNDQLSTLVSLQKTAQNTAALGFVGQKVGVVGSTAALTDGAATWYLNAPKPATATISIASSTGQTVFSGTYTVNAGTQPFNWDGTDTNGNQLPDGNYTMTVTAKDASGVTVAIPTEIEAVVDSADLTQTPPVLSVAGNKYTLDKITRVVR